MKLSFSITCHLIFISAFVLSRIANKYFLFNIQAHCFVSECDFSAFFSQVDEPSWSLLRDDFSLKAGMKEWTAGNEIEGDGTDSDD